MKLMPLQHLNVHNLEQIRRIKQRIAELDELEALLERSRDMIAESYWQIMEMEYAKAD